MPRDQWLEIGAECPHCGERVTEEMVYSWRPVPEDPKLLLLWCPTAATGSRSTTSDRAWTISRGGGLLWPGSVVLAVIALGWQVLYELERRACMKDLSQPQLLASQCNGPLDGWVLPVTLVAAALLLVVRLLPRRDR